MDAELLEQYGSKNVKEHREAVKVLHKLQQEKLGKAVSSPYSKVTVAVNDQLPRLSWICEVYNNKYDFTVGKSVEGGGGLHI